MVATRSVRRPDVRVALLLAVAVSTAVAAAQGGVAAGDAAWAARAEDERGGKPQPGPTEAAISAYEDALASSPGNLEARWKLLRALHFDGTFVAREEAEKQARFERARQLAEDGIEELTARLGAGRRAEELELPVLESRIAAATAIERRDVAGLYFWSAINWGAWSQNVGLLRAVREGVANRLRRYAEVTMALEPAYEQGGAFRLMGRLHAQLPRVPFLSGWVDREEAVPLLERAYRLAPEHPGNRLLLALTLIELEPERRAEGQALLEKVCVLEPRARMRVEDLAIREMARARRAEQAA